MSYIPEPITRIDKYLAYIAGNMDVALPDHPITRKEHYLAAWAEKSGFEDADVAGEPPLTLENAIGKPLKGLTLYGRSKQITTTGAQLLDPSKATVDGWNIKFDIPLEKSKTYTFTNGEKAANSVAIFGVNPDEADENLSVKYLSPKESYTFTCAKDYASILLGGSNEKTVIDGEYMLNAGSAPLPWEPYTGGRPSPSPDYPQEIESVGMKWSTGANLVDVHNAIKMNTYGLEVTVKDDGTIVISGTSSNNAKNLSFSFLDNKFSFPLTSIFKFFDVEEKNCKLSSVRRTNASNATNNKIAIDINQINSGSPIYCSFKLVVSEKTVEEYEPYTGGIPKPYGDKIGVNVRGKNLLRIDNSLEKYESNDYAGTTNRIISTGVVAIGLDDVNRFAPTFVSNCVIDNGSILYHTISAGFAVGVGMQLTPGQTYTCSFDSTNNGRLCLLYYDANGTFLKKQDFVKSTFTVPENVVYTVLLFRDADKAGDYKFWNIQLESGDTATSYEPYHDPQFASIATPNGLPGIPVSSGGNYTDADGQQRVCDEIDFARGVYVQRIVKEVLNGTERIKWISQIGDVVRFSIGTKYHAFENYNADISQKGLKGFFSHGTYYTNYSLNDIHGYAEGANMFIFLPIDILGNDADSIAAYMMEQHENGSPLTMCYIVTTPIETPLTADQLNAYKQLRTYKGTTIIDNDAGAYMSVKYEKMK